MSDLYKAPYGHRALVARQGFDEATGRLPAMGNTPFIDRHRTIFLPSAFQRGLDEVAAEGRVIPMLPNHQMRREDGRPAVVGRVVNPRVTPRGLAFEADFAPTEAGQEFELLFREGFMDAFSIQVLIHEVTFIENREHLEELISSLPRDIRNVILEQADGGSYLEQPMAVITRAEVLEISPVSIPSNRQSLAKASDEALALAARITGEFASDSVMWWEGLSTDECGSALRNLTLDMQGEEFSWVRAEVEGEIALDLGVDDQEDADAGDVDAADTDVDGDIEDADTGADDAGDDAGDTDDDAPAPTAGLMLTLEDGKEVRITAVDGEVRVDPVVDEPEEEVADARSDADRLTDIEASLREFREFVGSALGRLSTEGLRIAIDPAPVAEAKEAAERVASLLTNLEERLAAATALSTSVSNTTTPVLTFGADDNNNNRERSVSGGVAGSTPGVQSASGETLGGILDDALSALDLPGGQ